MDCLRISDSIQSEAALVGIGEDAVRLARRRVGSRVRSELGRAWTTRRPKPKGRRDEVIHTASGSKGALAVVYAIVDSGSVDDRGVPRAVDCECRTSREDEGDLAVGHPVLETKLRLHHLIGIGRDRRLWRLVCRIIRDHLPHSVIVAWDGVRGRRRRRADARRAADGHALHAAKYTIDCTSNLPAGPAADAKREHTAVDAGRLTLVDIPAVDRPAGARTEIKRVRRAWLPSARRDVNGHLEGRVAEVSSITLHTGGVDAHAAAGGVRQGKPYERHAHAPAAPALCAEAHEPVVVWWFGEPAEHFWCSYLDNFFTL